LYDKVWLFTFFLSSSDFWFICREEWANIQEATDPMISLFISKFQQKSKQWLRMSTLKRWSKSFCFFCRFAHILFLHSSFLFTPSMVNKSNWSSTKVERILELWCTQNCLILSSTQ
jgi:hypothetical protein